MHPFGCVGFVLLAEKKYRRVQFRIMANDVLNAEIGAEHSSHFILRLHDN